jgi:arylamine N-acetyltransferase
VEDALDDALAAAYLELLGVDAAPGGVDAPLLARLQRAHLEAVPFETIDIVRGAPPGIEPLGALRRILGGRGGYCYHLNGAFALLLEWLGVDVTRLRSGVQRRVQAEPPGATGTHLGLVARLDGGPWLVDVGLGDGPSEPLPLVPGEHVRDGFVFRLGPSSVVPGGWRLDHHPGGSFAGVDFAPDRATTADFSEMHAELSTSPSSPFVRVATVQKRSGARLVVLRGRTLAEHEDGSVHRRDVESGDEWWTLVLERFGVAYHDVPAAERQDLWRHVCAVHEAWDAAGRP